MVAPRTGNGRRKRVNPGKYGQPDDVEIVEHEPRSNGRTKNGKADSHKPKQADILIGLSDEVELFHTPDRTGFADVEINNNRETWRLRSREFRQWMARRFFEETESAPNSEALHAALNVIEARANFDARERTVHIRVGSLDGQLYLDLGDKTWRA